MHNSSTSFNGGNEMKYLNRNDRALRNQRLTDLRERAYSEQILHCYNNSVVYSTDDKVSTERNSESRTCINVDQMDTVSAIYTYSEGKTAVLNFASFCNPGGGFLNGSKAQEECLCEESILYNVLSRFQDYYAWNKHHRNQLLYCDRAIYTPNVLFSRNGYIVDCDVITCAAPNRFAAKKNYGVSDAENSEALEHRIDFLLCVAAAQKVDTLILGAFGCGVFGQDAKEVAQIFKRQLQHHLFDKVIFAIPDEKISKFKDIL